MRNSALGLILGFAVGFGAAIHFKDETECQRSVVHNGQAKCAIYINKDLVNELR